MKLSIRFKLFLLFLGFILFFLVSNILFNLFWMQDYYIYRYSGILERKSQEIKESYSQMQADNIGEYIVNVERSDGISVTITNRHYEMKYVSYPNRKSIQNSEFPTQIQYLIDTYKNMKEKAVCDVEEKRLVDIPKYIYYVERLDKGGLIILTKSMKGIGESVGIANEFYLYIGAIMILIGSIITSIFANRIAKPIIRMSKVAKNISNLDFSTRIQFNNQDEIGILGESINEISVKLSSSIQDLQQDIERRKQLTRDISHDLKTPIGVVKGYAEGLLYGIAGSQEKKDKYCRVIVEECDRMDSMVKKLLELSLLEDIAQEIIPTTFLIKEFLDSLIERFSKLIQKKKIQVSIECENDIKMTADRELMERAVSNFIENAIKFTTAGGEVVLKAEEKEEKIVISIFNSGVLIPEYELNKIWDVFYKLDKARGRASEGHGIGLSIARKIAKLHGGEASVKNEKNGVVFFISIPI